MNRECGGKQILLHGMSLVLVGLVWGLVVPHTPFPRLALSAHIGFEGSGILFIVVAILLLSLPNRFGRWSMTAMLLAVWLTWVMLASEMANSWWGTTQILPLAARQAGAAGGKPWQEAIVTGAHIAAGLALIAAWILLLIGFAKSPDRATAD